MGSLEQGDWLTGAVYAQGYRQVNQELLPLGQLVHIEAGTKVKISVKIVYAVS